MTSYAWPQQPQYAANPYAAASWPQQQQPAMLPQQPYVMPQQWPQSAYQQQQPLAYGRAAGATHQYYAERQQPQQQPYNSAYHDQPSYGFDTRSAGRDDEWSDYYSSQTAPNSPCAQRRTGGAKPRKGVTPVALRPWMHHLQTFYKAHKHHMSYKQAMRAAKKTFHHKRR